MGPLVSELGTNHSRIRLLNMISKLPPGNAARTHWVGMRGSGAVQDPPGD